MALVLRKPMRDYSIIFILFWILIPFSLNAQNSSKPKNVLEYYERLTSEQATFLQGGVEKKRQSLIKIQDIPNGYLKLQGADWDGWAELALFKKTSGDYVLGLADTGCAPACATYLRFFEYRDGQWIDVTDQVYPTMNKSEELMVYRLPQFGRTIEIKRSGEKGEKTKTLQKLNWDGSQFRPMK